MSNVNTAPIMQSPLTEPEKARKIRLCPAVFVAVAFIVYFFYKACLNLDYFFSGNIFQILEHIIYPFLRVVLLSALAITLFFRKPNFSVPAVLSVSLILPVIFDISVSFFRPLIEIAEYGFGAFLGTLTGIFLADDYICQLLLSVLISVVCFLLIIKSPKFKKFTLKRKNSTTVLIAVFYFVFSVLYFLTMTIIIASFQFSLREYLYYTHDNVFEFIIDEYKNWYLSYLFKKIIMVYLPTSLISFFVIRWLADPYKKDKNSAPQNADVQPAVPIPPAPPAPVRVAVERPAVINRPAPEKVEKIAAPVKPEPIVFAPPDVGSKHITDADAIQKYKDLLDNGALTQEEFDAVKKRILNI